LAVPLQGWFPSVDSLQQMFLSSKKTLICKFPSVWINLSKPLVKKGTDEIVRVQYNC